MSLYIGNIFSHVRQEDLECVFRKFGRCSVQVKDTSGFVDYGYRVNAKRALQALRGTRICGQLLSLSWSNRQPKPSPGPGARPVNLYESHHGRNFHKIHKGRNFHEFHHGRNLQKSQYRRNFPASQRGRNLPESQHGRNLPESQHGRNLSESHHERNLLKSQLERNHHESQHGRNLPESHHIRHTTKQSYGDRKLPSEGQMGLKKSVPDGRVFRPTDKTEDARNREKKNAEIYVMKKKLADAKREEQIDDLLHKGNDLENRSEFDRYEPCGSDDKRDHEYQGKEYGKKKRIRESQRPERRSPERLRARKSRKTMSSPSRSYDKVSRSKSNSKFSRSRSLSSSSSTFSSKSDSHRSRDHRSKSGSRSCSRASMNVSTSSGRSSTPPTRSDNGKSNLFTGSARNEVQKRTKSGSGSRSTSRASTPSGRSSTPPTKSRDGKNDSYTGTKRNEVQNRSTSGSLSRSSPRASLNVSTPPTKSPNGNNDSFTSPERNEGQIRSAPLVENENKVSASQKSEKNTRLPENGGLAEETLSPTIHNGTRDLEVFDLNISKVDSIFPKTMKSLCLTSEEILMVMKHYGLEQPDGATGNNVPVESFFGCARLWPSAVVNYRRLKKGPISIENYARRIFQNKAFGIVDRYVRSSSGWGEDTYMW